LTIYDAELTVIDDNYTIDFNVTAPCDIALLNNYTYTLLHRDYCQTELNSSQLNISIPLDDNVLPNTMIPISVNIESLIHDSTWSVALNVSNRFGSDVTDYTNITNNKTNKNQCYSEPILSLSTAIVLSQTVTPSLSSIYKSGSIQTSMDCTAVIITSTVYISNITTTPSNNVIPIVIGTTATVMILLIVVIILLIFMIFLCYKRSDIAGNRCLSCI
ncbi:PREDICTED: uncharacterized protein LOC109592367, partial [Amphimedon queenslandica]|uniref:Uncharacterized protein n=1 Tax=Amphimedon queenslandica TaxID=400682 RepID=A0AAN0K1I4_AMPQE